MTEDCSLDVDWGLARSPSVRRGEVVRRVRWAVKGVSGGIWCVVRGGEMNRWLVGECGVLVRGLL